MNSSKKKEIYEDLKLRLGFDREQIAEVIEETRYRILEHLEGSIEFDSIDEIMQDYLGFSDAYLDALFTLS